MLQVRAQEKDLALTFKAVGDVPENIETDPVRLRQIAFNLIGNSIKFTEQGGVEVSCRYQQEAGNSFFIIWYMSSTVG